MTVASTTREVPYETNGVTVGFPVPFYFIENEHLLVWHLVGDVATTLVEGSGYTVSGAGNANGGTVTTVGTPLNGGTLYIARVVPLEQLTEYQPNGAFPAKTNETALDYLMMAIQQLQASIALALSPDPLDPDGPFDAHGKRIINLADPIGMTDAVNLETLLSHVSDVSTGGLLAGVQIWKLTPDGTKTQFGIAGADVTHPEWYDVAVNGTLIEPTEGFNVQVGADTDSSVINFTAAPSNAAEVWVILRGTAKPVSDYVSTLINDQAFKDFLTTLITNTLYATTNVLDLGPLKYLIPLADVSTASFTVDGSKASYLLRSTGGDAAEFTIRGNTGDVDLDWDDVPNAAPFFSVAQVGDGQVTLLEGTGVTLRIPTGFSAATRAKNSVITATLDYASGGQWVLSGDLAPAANTGASVSSPVIAVASSAGVVDIDLALSDLFTLTLSENVTGWTIDHPPGASYGGTVRVRIIQNSIAANTVVWPASFKWPGGTAGAVSTATNATDMLTLQTFDGGTSYLARLDKAFA